MQYGTGERKEKKANDYTSIAFDMSDVKNYLGSMYDNDKDFFWTAEDTVSIGDDMTKKYKIKKLDADKAIKRLQQHSTMEEIEDGVFVYSADHMADGTPCTGEYITIV